MQDSGTWDVGMLSAGRRQRRRGGHANASGAAALVLGAALVLFSHSGCHAAEDAASRWSPRRVWCPLRLMMIKHQHDLGASVTTPHWQQGCRPSCWPAWLQWVERSGAGGRTELLWPGRCGWSPLGALQPPLV